MGDRGRRAAWAVPGVHAPEPLYCGTGSVLYRARREPGDAPVVVKLLRARGPFEQRDEVELWRMHSAGRGVHTLLQHGATDGGRPYAVMEECPDGDYRRVLTEQGPLTTAEAVAAGEAVADALAAVHARGLLHHAVVPENILRARFGPALIDFGSTLAQDHPFPPVHYRDGEREHAPPEELTGGAPGPASDVYRLASTVWTLLAGYAPFAGGPENETPAAYRRRVLGSAPPPVPRDDVPAWLQEVLRRGLATDPAERIADAAELAGMFRGEQASPPDPAGASEPPPRDLKRPGPRPDHRSPSAGAAEEGDRGTASADPATEKAAEELSAPSTPHGPSEGARPDGRHRRGGAESALPGMPEVPGAAGGTDPAPPADSAEPVSAEDPGARSPSGPVPPAEPARGYADPVPPYVREAMAGAAGAEPASGIDAVPEPPYALKPPSDAADAARTGAAPPSALHVGPVADDRPRTPPPPAPGQRWNPAEPARAVPSAPTGPPAPDTFAAGGRRRRAGRVALYALALSALLVVVSGAAWWASSLVLSPTQPAPPRPLADAGASVEPSAPSDGQGAQQNDAGGADTAEDAAQDAAEDSGPQSPQGDAAQSAATAPTSVEVRDGTISVTLSWTDNSGGTATHYVVGGPVGAEEETSMAGVAPGGTNVEITGLNPEVEYCFRVVAVQSTDLSSASKEVCTDRDP